MMSRNNNTAAGKEKTNRSVSSLLENRLILFIVSLVCATCVWAVVSSTQTTEQERVVTGVTVQINADDSFTEATGMRVYGKESYTVDVTVKGQSYLINSKSLGAENITVTASLDAVASPGEYQLPLYAKTSSDDVTIVKVSPQTVTVRFDEPASRTFTLTESLEISDNYKLAPGLIRENPTISRETVEVSGPASEIAKITEVKAVAKLTGEVSSTTKYEAELVLVSDGSEIDKTDIVIDSDGPVYVTVPVTQSGTYGVKVNFSNVPADYRETGIEYTITPDTAEATFTSGSATTVNDDGTITVGTIDYNKINNEVNYIKIVNDTISETPVTFTVRIDMSDMYKRWIEIPVDVTNYELPANVKVNSTSVKSVQIVGPEQNVKNVDSTVAYAVPILEGLDLTKPGTYTVPAKIILRTLTNAWIYNTYQLEITVS